MAKSEGRPTAPGLKLSEGAAIEPAQDDPTAQAMASLGGARGMVRMQGRYATAIKVSNPRDLKDVERRVIFEAARMGEDFIYTWRQRCKPGAPEDEGNGWTTIEGMSIDGAMVLARNFGNCAIETELADETPTHFMILAAFIDHETGFTFPRLYRQRKSGGPGGKMDADRKEDLAFQIAQSKAQRNVIDKVAPPYLIAAAVHAAKGAAAERFKDLDVWIPRVLKHAHGLGVSQARLCERIRKPVQEWAPFDIMTFQVIFNGIKAKETTPAEEFPEPEQAAPPATATPEPSPPAEPARRATVRHLEETSEGPYLVECSRADCQDPMHAGGTIGDSAAYLDAQKAARTASASTETKGAGGEAPPPSSKPKPPQGEAPTPTPTPEAKGLDGSTVPFVPCPECRVAGGQHKPDCSRPDLGPRPPAEPTPAAAPATPATTPAAAQAPPAPAAPTPDPFTPPPPKGRKGGA